ncbi:MAG: hypothetical protein QNJ85_08935 [Gammaproteobacteria bacterium]|nr:hypothetical protein [Gammaproteobacteria bacterium]
MRLIELVERYAREPQHRSGTDAEKRTRDWLVSELEARSLATSLAGFEFSRFDADWSLSLDDRFVEALPLFYCAEGEFDLAGAGLYRLQPDHWNEASTLARIEAMVETERRRGGAGLALATESADGRVSAINVASDYHPDFPILLFGVRDWEEAAAVGGSLRARRQTSASASIVARGADSPQLVLVTSYTGWFGCAAERGAGLAILLGLVSRLADRIGLAVVVTSGHEHHHLGGTAVRAQESFAAGIPVLHLGSCIASTEGSCRVTHNLAADEPASWFSGQRFELRRLPLGASPVEWAGEAADWIDGQRPVLSLSGIDQHFHTPADTADKLDPAELETTLAACERAAMAIFAAGTDTITRQS